MAFILFATVRAAPAEDVPLGSAAPAKALAALFVRPVEPTSERTSSIFLAATLVDQARHMGLLSDLSVETSLWLDGFAMLPVLLEQPFAVVLTDMEARPDAYGGFRLAGMRIGLVLRTEGRDAHIAGAIQRFLTAYTNTEVSRIDQREAGGRTTVHRLVDSRLPDWAVVEWGAVEGSYLVTGGRGAFDELASTLRGSAPSLSDDLWFASASQSAGGPGATMACYVHLAGLRAALRPTMGDKPDAVAEALGLGETTRGLWCGGRGDRAVFCRAVLDRADGEETVQIAAPADDSEQNARLIPNQARTYALLRWNPVSHVSRICRTYLACRSPKARDKVGEFWEELQSELGISLQRDLVQQLGPRILIHDDPPHPLGIGLLCTVQLEIAGSSEIVRQTVDKLLRHWQRQLEADSSEGRQPRLGWGLRRSDDDVWYIQFGLYGPAITVLDRWVVLSFSPTAVRQNRSRIQPAESATVTGASSR